jgi:regulator of sigma E protease
VGSLSGFILILLGFGFLIFVHELGHFLAAKWANIRADGFAIGMGPCLVSYRKGVGFCFGSADDRVVARWNRRPIEIPDAEREELGLGETEYSLRALPIGGYVRMLGQEDGAPGRLSDDRRSFSQATIGRRAVVILAGITANLLLAMLLFLIAFLAGVRFPSPLIGMVVPDSPAAKAVAVGKDADAGLQPGDRVVGLDGDEVRTFLDLRVGTAMAKPDTPVEIEVERRDAEGVKRLRFVTTPVKDEATGLLSIGVDPARSATITAIPQSADFVRSAIRSLAPDLADAGVGPGSRITAVDGKPIATYAEFERALIAAGGNPVVATFTGLAGPNGTEEATTRELTVRPERIMPVMRDAESASNLPPDVAFFGIAPLARVASVVEESANRDVLRAGDVFLRVGSAVAPRTSELMSLFRASPSATLKATLLRDGAETTVELRTDRNGRVGVQLEPALDLAMLARPIEQTEAGATPARELDIVPLGSVLSVDDTPVESLREFCSALQSIASGTAQGESRVLRIGLRDPSPEARPSIVSMTVGASDLEGLRSLGVAPPLPAGIFDPEFTVLSANGNPLTAIAMGFRQTFIMVEQVFLTIDRVTRGSVGVDQLQGPVGILHTGTQVASEGFMFMLFFLAMISVNLAVVNLLPIPIADGGLFVFLMYEKFRGRPPSIAFQNAAALAGIALVAGLFLLTFYNDLARIFG